MNPWKDETHTPYTCKKVPYVRINVMQDDEIVYSFALDNLSYYRCNFGYQYQHNQNYAVFGVDAINPKDYAVLVSKHYDKYILEIQQEWQDEKTGDCELIELPSMVFKNMLIDYSINEEYRRQSIWRIEFNNNER